MWSGSNEGQSLLCPCLPAECGQDSPVPREGRSGWQSAGTEGEERGGQDWQGAVWSGNRSFWITQIPSIQLESCSSVPASHVEERRRRSDPERAPTKERASADWLPEQRGREGEKPQHWATWISVTAPSLWVSHPPNRLWTCLFKYTHFTACTLTVGSARRRERSFLYLGPFFYFGEKKKFFGVLMVSGAAEVLIFFYPSFSDVMSRLSRTMESGPEPGRHWRRSLSPGRVLPPPFPGRCGSPSSLSPPLCVPWSSSSHLPRRAAGRGGGTARGGSRRSSRRSPTSSSAPTWPRRPWEPAGDPRARLRATRSASKSWRRITTQTLSSRMRRTRAQTGSWPRWGGGMSGYRRLPLGCMSQMDEKAFGVDA